MISILLEGMLINNRCKVLLEYISVKQKIHIFKTIYLFILYTIYTIVVMKYVFRKLILMTSKSI